MTDEQRSEAGCIGGRYVAVIMPGSTKPEWLKVRAPGSDNYLRLRALMQTLNLHTVCEEARCPNIGECWHHGTATFMILGAVCTRACAYCAVAHGRPQQVDATEPVRVAEAIRLMGDKIEARRAVQKVKVPVVPGSDGSITEEE